mmetsp:Transcript_31168/g.78046  ORF Transcript_31168/g.78046 Transcript_31168/m.78046 type:complete len:239 (+) Transcript_31168:2500-3216(+)
MSAGVDDEADVVNGHGRLRHVGGQHDLADARRCTLEHRQLLLVGQVAVEGHHPRFLRLAVEGRAVGERLEQRFDLLEARYEDEHRVHQAPAAEVHSLGALRGPHGERELHGLHHEREVDGVVVKRSQGLVYPAVVAGVPAGHFVFVQVLVIEELRGHILGATSRITGLTTPARPVRILLHHVSRHLQRVLEKVRGDGKGPTWHGERGRAVEVRGEEVRVHSSRHEAHLEAEVAMHDVP